MIQHTYYMCNPVCYDMQLIRVLIKTLTIDNGKGFNC